MAEVEKLATSTAATDIPISSGSGGVASGVIVGSNISNDASVSAEYGTSPTQERSSNSHPHDSEYDTASDLEGGEEYDDDEEDDLDDEDDLTDEEDVDDDDDDIDDDDAERPSGIGAGSQEKVSEAEIQKKVDEDRSNPQYIPKRGTFYEHDDRMADGDNDGVLAIGDPVGNEGGVGGAGGNAKSSAQTPSISHASKTMKKWQPASGVERWTHDRFEESEQQPKSRSELISAYGYDIRTEDAPPRARRRRRYARGPTKYSRNWEDENAYIKINNKERKPPRASDFPALNERTTRKQRREPREREENARDEKENRPERRRAPINKSSVNERLNIAAGRPSQNEDLRDREDIRARISGRPKIQGRQSTGPSRQAPMEFKPKSRNNKHNASSQQQSNNTHNNSRSDERGYDRPSHRGGQYQNNSVNEQFQQKSSMKSTNASHMKQNQPNSQQFHGDSYSNNNNQTSKYNEQHGNYSQPQQQQQQQQMQSGIQHHSQQQGLSQMRQSMPLKSTPPPSNLSQRLQQVQNRNDPSHVGSVQMHALATQNQQQQLVMGQQPNANAMLISAVAQQQQQQQQQLMQGQPQEQRGPPKRYSSMRRSQHDPQHINEPHTHQQQQQMQQLHMSQPPPPQQQTPQAPQQIIMQDQHSIMQANLLQQLYHQENLQAQMQALQVSQPPPAQQAKQPAYAAVPSTAAPPAQPPAYGANPANTAYYVTDAYGAAAPNAQAPPQPTQYAPQQPAYLAPTPATAAALGYTNPPPTAQPNIQAGPPTGVYAGPAGTGPPATPNSNQNYSNYQNYNTVGGTTYFVPPAPTTSRPVVLPQRRPTNAIPILPPAEKNKQRGNDTSKDEASKSLSNSNSSVAPIGSAENIDHIIDNMFVQRPAFQQPQSAALSARQSSSPSNSDSISSNVGTDTQTQTSSADDSNVASNNLVSNPAETSNNSSNSTAVTEEVAISTNLSSTENSSNNNPITAQE